MTYREKFNELSAVYVKSSQDLQEVVQAIAIGDNLDNYDRAYRQFISAERNFKRLFRYTTSKGINPDSEFVELEFMYRSIKDDQVRKGIHWPDEQATLQIGNGNKLVGGKVGLTNDDQDIDQPFGVTEYQFPVVSLDHGRECYQYLSDHIIGDDKLNTQELKFEHISQEKQIYVRVCIEVRRD